MIPTDRGSTRESDGNVPPSRAVVDANAHRTIVCPERARAKARGGACRVVRFFARPIRSGEDLALAVSDDGADLRSQW